MNFKFTPEKIAEIEKVLGIKFSRRGDQYRAIIENDEKQRRLTLEIFPDIAIGFESGNLVNVYTALGHAQLHFCTGYVASEVLGEVTFIGEYQKRLSGIIVEKAAAFSIYSNVDAALLSADFSRLGPEVMLSGIALSLAEPLLENQDRTKK